MALESAISWTDGTWNPGVGCAKVSAGCKNCYMFRDMARYGRDPRAIHRTSDATFRAPLKRRRDGSWVWPDGMDVFTASWSDWWLAEWDLWRGDAWSIIAARPGLRFFLLSKRPENITPERLPPGWPLPNVVLGVSIEDAAHLWRAKALRAFADRYGAAATFVSAEPLLGSLGPGIEALAGFDWLIGGGESGAGARPTHPAWGRELRDFALAHGQAFHWKQWGRFLPTVGSKDAEVRRWLDEDRAPRVWWKRPTIILSEDGQVRDGEEDAVKTWRRGDVRLIDVGANHAGRMLDGRTWDDRPPRARETA